MVNELSRTSSNLLRMIKELSRTSGYLLRMVNKLSRTSSSYLLRMVNELSGTSSSYLLRMVNELSRTSSRYLLCHLLNPIQTGRGGGGGRLTPPRLKSFLTHERLCLQCSYFVTFPQIYLETIWCC